MNISPTMPESHELSEAEFLRLQAKLAREGATRAINETKLALAAKLDPRGVARKHPILTILSASVAGFAAASATIPSKKEQELRRLERLHRATHPEPVASIADGKAKPSKPPLSHSIWSTIIHELITLIKPILLASITASVKSATDQSPRNDGQGAR